MKILYINHYAGGPHYGMEFRPYYLSREWVKAGHEVLILAASFSHVRAQQPKVTDRPEEELYEGIVFRWYPTPSYAGNGVRRVWNMLSFLGWLYRDGKRIAREFQPEVVIASSTYPMDIWPARRIAKITGAKLVFEVHDLWPLSPIELGGMSRWHPFTIWVQMAEDAAYRHADVVISMLPKVQEYMESRGLKPGKLHIVPNGVALEEWQTNTSPLQGYMIELFSRLKNEGWRIVGYTGAHGVANALGILLDAAALMKDERIAFVLVGSGPNKEDLQQRADTEPLNNVWFINPVKKEQIAQILAWFDVAYIGLQKQPLFRFGIAPNKLMDYMMAAKPIVMAIDSGNDPVVEAGCGLTVKPEDPQAIAQGIRNLLALDEDERRTIGLRGRAYIMDNHAYSVLGQRFLEIISHNKPLF